MFLYSYLRETETTLNSAILEGVDGIGRGLAIRDFYSKDVFLHIRRIPHYCLCNQIPHMTDRTNSIWRRMICVKFGANFTDKPSTSERPGCGPRPV